jgi:hypothetical protein
MADERLRGALIGNLGHAYLSGARSMGRPWREDEDLILSDLGLPMILPPNNATLLREPTGERAAEGVAARVDTFFAGSAGGGYELWSAWPRPDLTSFGFSPGTAPCMVRSPGGELPPDPPGLEVVEVDGADGMREVWRVVDEVFCGGRLPDPMWDERVLRDDYRVWVGRVDGRPVTTATASISDGFVGVYAVGTIAEARGRGYGEAVTWAATLCRPDLPATLQASPMGLPVYERMGYRTVMGFTAWDRPHRARPRPSEH